MFINNFILDDKKAYTSGEQPHTISDGLILDVSLERGIYTLKFIKTDNREIIFDKNDYDIFINIVSKWYQTLWSSIRYTIVKFPSNNFKFEESLKNSVHKFFQRASEIENFPIDSFTAEGLFEDYKRLRNISFSGQLKGECKNMFKNCESLIQVPYFETRYVTDMSRMFYNCYLLEDVHKYHTENVTNMEEMFYGCKGLMYIPNLKYKQVRNMSNMFYDCTRIKEVFLMNVDNVIDTSNMFKNCRKIENVVISGNCTIENVEGMFENCVNLVTTELPDISKAKKLDRIFKGCEKIKTLPEALDQLFYPLI